MYTSTCGRERMLETRTIKYTSDWLLCQRRACQMLADSRKQYFCGPTFSNCLLLIMNVSSHEPVVVFTSRWNVMFPSSQERAAVWPVRKTQCAIREEMVASFTVKSEKSPSNASNEGKPAIVRKPLVQECHETSNSCLRSSKI